MARGRIPKPTLLLLLRSYKGMRGLSKICGKKVEAAGVGGGEERSYEVSRGSEKSCGGGGGGGGTVWVPHARTGIYVPRGQEWVMKDVPENAATFTHTCWFRNDQDLNHPNPSS